MAADFVGKYDGISGLVQALENAVEVDLIAELGDLLSGFAEKGDIDVFSFLLLISARRARGCFFEGPPRESCKGSPCFFCLDRFSESLALRFSRCIFGSAIYRWQSCWSFFPPRGGSRPTLLSTAPVLCFVGCGGERDADHWRNDPRKFSEIRFDFLLVSFLTYDGR